MSDAYYITPNETALAVVANAVKKKRLGTVTLVVNSLTSGVFLSVSGMLYVTIEAGAAEQLNNSSWWGMRMMQGAVYSLGLIFIVLNGCELFNSNVMFFTVGLLRRQVHILDLLRNWCITFIFNLGGSLFYAYVICYASGLAKTESYKVATIDISEHKVIYANFLENFLRGMACNFLVCLGVYMSIMCKPFPSRCLAMFLPIFAFVASGFEHVVADMFLVPIGMFNGASFGVGKYLSRSMIPVALGNMVGGIGFAVIVPFYLHLTVVEMDRKKEDLPVWETRDEQPDLQMDSRIVRIPNIVEPERMRSHIDTDYDSLLTEKREEPLSKRASRVQSRTKSLSRPGILTRKTDRSGSQINLSRNPSVNSHSSESDSRSTLPEPDPYYGSQVFANSPDISAPVSAKGGSVTKPQPAQLESNKVRRKSTSEQSVKSDQVPASTDTMERKLSNTGPFDQKSDGNKRRLSVIYSEEENDNRRTSDESNGEADEVRASDSTDRATQSDTATTHRKPISLRQILQSRHLDNSEIPDIQEVLAENSNQKTSETAPSFTESTDVPALSSETRSNTFPLAEPSTMETASRQSTRDELTSHGTRRGSAPVLRTLSRIISRAPTIIQDQLRGGASNSDQESLDSYASYNSEIDTAQRYHPHRHSGENDDKDRIKPLTPEDYLWRVRTGLN